MLHNEITDDTVAIESAARDVYFRAAYRAAYAEESVRVMRADLVSAVASMSDRLHVAIDHIQHALIVADRVLNSAPKKLLP